VRPLVTPILCVTGGPGRGHEFPIREGSTVVGRAADCTISIADPGLSRRHFEVTWDGAVCAVRDLGSRNGVTVNGLPVRQAIVRPGDLIGAGAVCLRLDVTGGPESIRGSGRRLRAPEAPKAAPAARPLRPIFERTPRTLEMLAPPPSPGSLRWALDEAVDRRRGHRLHALIDGARAFELAFAARMMGHRLFTLFSGPLADVASHVGPCLVALDEPSAFLDRWVKSLGSHAGVLFQSDRELDVVGAHLRQRFVTTDQAGQEFYFRFYDPRVFRVFLPECGPRERADFFGPVSCWIVESADGTCLELFALEGSGPIRADAQAERSDSSP
jgi:hypothetical protein